MTEKRSDAREVPDELDLLTPWAATGRLSPAEAARLDGLATGEERARRGAVAEEERAAVVAANAAIPEPSAAARAAVFARIGALEAQAAARPAIATPVGKNLASRVVAWIAGLSPTTVGLAGAAAAILIVVQAAAIVAGLAGRQGDYRVASSGVEAAGSGAFALVGFAPDATAAQIEALLAQSGATIVDGPRPGGLYRLRIATRTLTESERDAALGTLRSSRLVRLALPAGP